MRLGRCPDEHVLELFLYRDLDAFKTLSLRLHLMFCQECRYKLEELKNFDSLLSKIPPVDPPLGFEEELLQMVNSWPPMGEVKSRRENNDTSWLKIRVKWRLGAAMCALSWLFQLIFGDIISGFSQGGFLTSIADIQATWQFVISGQMWQSLEAIVAALNIDVTSALGIMGSTIPIRVMSVLLCGGLIIAVFVVEIRSARSGGDKKS